MYVVIFSQLNLLLFIYSLSIVLLGGVEDFVDWSIFRSFLWLYVISGHRLRYLKFPVGKRQPFRQPFCILLLGDASVKFITVYIASRD